MFHFHELLDIKKQHTTRPQVMDSSLDDSILPRQPLRAEQDEGEEGCMSGYEDDLCTQPVDPRPLAGKFGLLSVFLSRTHLWPHTITPTLPHIHHTHPHTGLIVYVDVRSGTDSCQNHSEATAHQLETLGATVSPRPSFLVSPPDPQGEELVIFTNASLTTYSLLYTHVQTDN